MNEGTIEEERRREGEEVRRGKKEAAERLRRKGVEENDHGKKDEGK